MNIPPKYEDVVAKLDAALGREAALREELDLLKPTFESTFDAAQRDRAERDALQQRLTVAEQRADDLESLLRNAQSFVEQWDDDSQEWMDLSSAISNSIPCDSSAALKPAAELTIQAARQSLRFENQRNQSVRFHCLACGEYHEGSGNLPCPKMKPMSGVKP